MNPYDHARSSVKLYGGKVEAFLPLHQWLDASKTTYCRFPHRFLRHHLEGIDEATAVFGPMIDNGAGTAVPTDEIGRQHLREDLGIIATATSWLTCIEPDHAVFPEEHPSCDELAAISARNFGGALADYQPLHAWFLETAAWFPDSRHLALRHHSFGSFAAEERFGPAIALTGGNTVPTRVVAERHIRRVIGQVPPTSDILRRIKAERWMAQPAAR
jgi:hypothetical protein